MISIVVPIYNAEKYLRQCVESVLSQKCRDMELLLINDGSKDGSLNICKEFAQRDSRVLVIDKPNGGVSQTRNLGIDRAKGEYILFVDADDYLADGALEKINDALLKNDPDMLLWGFAPTEEEAIKNDTHVLCRNTGGFEHHGLLKHFITMDSEIKISGFVWRCAFRRAMLNDGEVRFCESLRMSEDFKFLLDATLVAKQASVLPEELYIYRINEDSVTSGYKENVHRDMAWINGWIERSICSRYPELRAGLTMCCVETYIVALMNMCNLDTPYRLIKRFLVAWKIKRDFSYERKILCALTQWKKLSSRRKIVLCALAVYLEPLYILLFSIKRRRLLKRNKRQNQDCSC